MCEIVEALDELQKATRIDLSFAYGNVPWEGVRRKLLERNDFSCIYLCARASVNVQELCIERGLFPLPILVMENMPRKGIKYENLWFPIIRIMGQKTDRAWFVEHKSQAFIKQVFPKIAKSFTTLKDISIIKPKKANPVVI